MGDQGIATRPRAGQCGNYRPPGEKSDGGYLQAAYCHIFRMVYRDREIESGLHRHCVMAGGVMLA